MLKKEINLELCSRYKENRNNYIYKIKEKEKENLYEQVELRKKNRILIKFFLKWIIIMLEKNFATKIVVVRWMISYNIQPFDTNDAAFVFPSCAKYLFVLPLLLNYNYQWWRIFSKILFSRKCFISVFKHLQKNLFILTNKIVFGVKGEE